MQADLLSKNRKWKVVCRGKKTSIFMKRMFKIKNKNQDKILNNKLLLTKKICYIKTIKVNMMLIKSKIIVIQYCRNYSRALKRNFWKKMNKKIHLSLLKMLFRTTLLKIQLLNRQTSESKNNLSFSMFKYRTSPKFKKSRRKIKFLKKTIKWHRILLHWSLKFNQGKMKFREKIKNI